jgi:putative glutamine amidotransferase
MIETVIKIGLTYTGTDVKHNNYINWLQQHGSIEVTRLSVHDHNLDAVAEMDGIVLSGGLDMHPKYYNSDVTDYPNMPAGFDEQRDAFEIAVFETSQLKQIPVLAVCRGMQLVNCILGGTLNQDIGPVGNAIHQFDINDKAHGINIVPGTILNEITGIERSVTNSAHHQSINRLGNGLAVNCISDDGIIEGIEWDEQGNKAFLLGVQWHPERLFKLNLGDSPMSKNIRERFITEIQQSITNHL